MAEDREDCQCPGCDTGGECLAGFCTDCLTTLGTGDEWGAKCDDCSPAWTVHYHARDTRGGGALGTFTVHALTRTGAVRQADAWAAGYVHAAGGSVSVSVEDNGADLVNLYTSCDTCGELVVPIDADGFAPDTCGDCVKTLTRTTDKD